MLTALPRVWHSRHSLTMHCICTFFLPPLYPSSWISSRFFMHTLNPDKAMGRKKEYFLPSHTPTTTQISTGSPLVQKRSLFEEEWRRTNREKNRFKRLLVTEVATSPRTLLWMWQTKQWVIFFVCLFLQEQKLITLRWGIAILCFLLMLRKWNSMTLDYVSFMYQPPGYRWRKTVFNHHGFFGLPSLS